MADWNGRVGAGLGLERLRCALVGHSVSTQHLLDTDAHARQCRCGAIYLQPDGSCTRIRHTLSCFFGGHSYTRAATRDDSHEYVCVRCGHPLVFSSARDPYAARGRFAKRVRYACNLLGHRVRTIARRAGLTEYACFCGHSFLKEVGGLAYVRHPLICFFSGHRVHHIATRDGYEEFVCRDCGHPFLFARRGDQQSPERL